MLAIRPSLKLLRRDFEITATESMASYSFRLVQMEEMVMQSVARPWLRSIFKSIIRGSLHSLLGWELPGMKNKKENPRA